MKPSSSKSLFELIHAPSGVVVARKIVRARGFIAQGKGLLGRRELEPGEGLWLDGAGSVHTLGMRFFLDILFLDRQFATVGWDSRVAPHRFFLGRRGSKSVIELAAGALSEVPSIALGDTWLLRPVARA